MCGLFGCTDWQRKFRLEMLGPEGQRRVRALEEGESVHLRLVPLRTITPAERWLLAKVMWIVGTYSAIGGKTVLKPQESEKLGKDYGLFTLVKNLSHPSLSSTEVAEEWKRSRQGRNQAEWPDLRRFFFVRGRFLWRKEMNELMGLTEEGDPKPQRTALERFLGSTQPGVSKKLFSFQANGGRIWGYVKTEAMLKEVKQRLQKEFNIPASQIKTGEEATPFLTTLW